ncbi:alpha/beta fold hydrolase [uncultured Abyssibacter sp.]|uniref:alpha/beta fold hydrolase n=1 Tax=uncultured Abyssibacter sp. TaxID=2320202 RepID=UPI0032B12DA4
MSVTPDPAQRLVVFAHGMESGPWGTKIQALAAVAARLGFAVDSPDYSHTMDPHARVRQLQALAPQSACLVLAGSSMGGYVSAQSCSALRPEGLFLLAPALYYPGFDEEPRDIPAISTVIHGWQDTVIPPASAIRFAQTHQAELHMLEDEHRLIESLPLIELLFERFLVRVGECRATSD